MIRKITVAAAVTALALAPSAADAQSTDMDIVATAVEAGAFTTLAAALEAADLIGVLQGAGPFTVFAPTDEAFAKLPAGTVEALLADKEALTRVLTYHVVSGRVMADAVVDLSRAMTLAGIDAPIEVRMGSVYVGGSKVTTADVAASNGVIHIIDTVMLPPGM
ncbi:MAG: fasciclin domain-containing protein [Gemmatimonadetes bacterium]|nr:fasciclin domain-containing protein [Gemmatimonadota bacterium]MDA1103961.1 fasciclin domain-containing protein [Gemmatimonadota bacterium]